MAHVALAEAPPLNAQTLGPANNHMLLIDASRSMWGKLGKDPKYLSLKNTLPNFIAQLPADVPVGTMVFGGTKRSSCKDVSYPIKLSKPDKSAYEAYFSGYKPKGKAPISFALTKAANALNYKTKAANIILIADGYDTCRAGPCSTIKTLHKQAKQLKVHVIGLQLSKQNIENFQCLSNVTGGTFSLVKTEDALSPALQKAFQYDDLVFKAQFSQFLELHKEQKEKEQKEKEKKKRLQKFLTGPSRIRLNAVMGTQGAPVTSDIQWRVFAKDSENNTSSVPVAESSDASPLLHLEPGTYEVEARFGDLIRVQQVVTAPEQGMLSYILDLDAGIINVSTSQSQASLDISLEGVLYAVYKAKHTPSQGYRPIARSGAQRPQFKLPAGDYVIVTFYNGLSLEHLVRVVAGKVENINLVFNTGQLQLSSVAHATSTPLAQMLYSIYPVRQENSFQNVGNPIKTAVGIEPVVTLPVGEYIVLAEHKLLSMKRKISVQANKKTHVQINFNASTLRLNSILPNRLQQAINGNLSYKIYRVIENANQDNASYPEPDNLTEVAHTTRQQPSYLLSPGTYLVRGRFGVINAVSEKKVSVTAGKDIPVTLSFDAGRVKLSLISEGQSFPSGNVFWKIFTKDNDNRVIWNSSQRSPELILAAQAYRAVAEYRGKRYERSFNVKPGEDFSLEIVAKSANAIR